MPKKNNPSVLPWLPLVSMGCSLIVAGLGWTAWIVRNVAQTTYVDDAITKQAKYVDNRFTEVVRYIDDKAINLRKEAFDHSDLNRSELQTQYKTVESKLDMLIMMQQQQQNKK